MNFKTFSIVMVASCIIASTYSLASSTNAMNTHLLDSLIGYTQPHLIYSHQSKKILLDHNGMDGWIFGEHDSPEIYILRNQISTHH